ncbi:hypothetical protein C3K47_08365 [Solitalea longa]|uniref:Uncharacterized protein n=1 Tax=Solitalea longa TaxID=2079460 RepID=A0A2S5A422_9SPHI|nr:hypothetical protein [Solitalea longa]POY37062.1 hypothetical protein C3K47_08365 [Solitalea longa]
MKTYLIYKLSYLLMLGVFGVYVSGSQLIRHTKYTQTNEVAAKTIAQRYTIEKLKPFTTKLIVPLEKMTITSLGNGYYKILVQVDIAYNAIPERLTYEISLHYTDDDYANSVIDSFRRIEK